MFSLYGDWGSGKSSLMKFLQKELKNDFNTFFFEAWEFEKDDNLALSLLEFITKETSVPSEDFYKNILKYGNRILTGLGKSIKINIPLKGLDLEINPSSIVDEIVRENDDSFYVALKNFKTEFQRLEDFITKGDNPKYNIIFIDDLDRCEPQQVLNLMSAVKLFFTYGTKTIFFCGIDKKAVEEAVKTKYGKVVKANEYLEKIFDITFSMPGQNDLLKLTNHYFDERLYKFDNENIAINYRINDFFKEIEFSNPRRIKKVLNKFQILREFRHSYSHLSDNFPNIDMKNNTEKGFFETILVLYLIILHEFYPDDFENFLNFDKKKDIYIRAAKGDTNQISYINQAINTNFSNRPFSAIYNYISGNTNKSHIERCFYICLSPLKIQKNDLVALTSKKASDIVVEEKYIDYLFYKYINRYDIGALLSNNKSDSTLLSIKKLIKDFL